MSSLGLSTSGARGARRWRSKHELSWILNGIADE
jgi:hypothetical protein